MLNMTDEQNNIVIAEEHLQGLAEWQQPQAGMFAWMKLCGGIKDADQILDKLKEEKVVVVPGWSLVLMKLVHMLASLAYSSSRAYCNHGVLTMEYGILLMASPSKLMQDSSFCNLHLLSCAISYVLCEQSFYCCTKSNVMPDLFGCSCLNCQT